MRTSYLNRIIGVLGTLLVLLAFSACNPQNEAPGEATLTVSVEDATSKLIGPDAENVDISHYRITVSNDNGAIAVSDLLPKNNAYTLTGLVPGEWDILAEGYVKPDASTEAVKVAGKKESIQLTAGSNPVKITLDTLDETPAGTVSIMLLLPPEAVSGGSFQYWYSVVDMAGEEAMSSGSEIAPLTGTCTENTGSFDITGINQGSYLLFVSVNTPEGAVTAVDAMRLLPGVDAIGSLTVVSMNEGDVTDEGLTVDDLVGDLLEFSVKDGTTYNITDDPDDRTFNGSLKIGFPSVYRYKFYIDGVEWTSVGHGGSGESSFYQIKELNSLTPGRHVMSVVGYTLSTAAEVGSVDIILDKLEVGLEKESIFTFSLNEDGQSYTVTGLRKGMSQENPDVFEIPSQYRGKPVTRIGGGSFDGRDDIVGTVIIPDTVISIGGSAFFGCSGLTSVDIPGGVTSIGSGAFFGCSGLTSVDIPGGVTSIGSGAFFGCSGLTSIDIPGGVTSIGSSAFFGCSGLTSIDIPGGVTSIESDTFRNCSGLTVINLSDCLESIGDYAFAYCKSLTSIDIPGSVKSIGNRTFEGCTDLTSIDFSKALSLGGALFSGCSSLTSVILPDGIKSIGGEMFNDCTSLTSIDIPNGVTSIGPGAFSGCSLTNVTIPDSVIEIGNSAFSECNMTSVFIPDGVTRTYYRLFSFCSALSDIYCEASAQPEGWNSRWLDKCNADVFWGASRSDYDSIKAGSFDVAEPVIAFTTDGNTCSITSDTSFAHIYYTTDGSDPTAENGTRYEAPFAVEEGKTVKAVAYVGNGIYSDVMTMEAPQQLPTPTLTSRYDGSVYRVYLNNVADYPEEAQVYFRYVCDELDPDPGFTLRGYASEFNGLELYDTGGFNTGTAECYIVYEGYRQSETASLQLEEKQQLPTPILSFSDGELMITNSGDYSEYGNTEDICFIASSDYDFVQNYDASEYQGDGFTLGDYSEGLIDPSEYGYDGSGAYYIRAIDISGYYESSEIAVYDPSGN